MNKRHFLSPTKCSKITGLQRTTTFAVADLGGGGGPDPPPTSEWKI